MITYCVQIFEQICGGIISVLNADFMVVLLTLAILSIIARVFISFCCMNRK